MKNLGIVLLCFFVFAGCDRRADFLEKVPPPPYVPPPPVPPPPPDNKVVQNSVLDVTNVTSVSADVDILWVIDNSGSMGSYQLSVIDNTRVFIENFTSRSALRWRMGLISTDLSNAPYIGFTSADALNWKTLDPIGAFQAAVGKLGTSGDSTERTYDPVIQALTANPSFLRPEAYFALIIVTDEEEQSATSTVDFVKRISALKGGDQSRFITYGVFSTQGNPCFGFYDDSTRYGELMKATNSKVYQLCSPQFGEVLSNLGEDLVQKITELSPVIHLDYYAIPSSIKVTYKGVLLKPGLKSLGGDWTYDDAANVIRINDVHILDSSDRYIRIDYEKDMNYYQ